MNKTILIASDHGGYALKEAIRQKFADFTWIDLGTNSPDSVDYPDFGYKLAQGIAAGKAPRGIAICGSGIGISIAVNREPAVRGALCADVTMARLSRMHNDANVLVLGERTTGQETAFQIVEAFLNTDFEGGRHQRRVDKLSEGKD